MRGRLLAVCAALALAPTPGARAEAGSPREVVVLLHGLARTDRAMRPLAKRLEAAGYEVHALHYDSMGKPPDALVADLDAELAACCATAERIDFVTHSLGSILLRAELAEHPLPRLGRVVMLAPPNHGSELADRLRGSAALRPLLGPTAVELGTDEASLPNRLPPASFEVGVIAGTGSVNPIGSHMIPGEDDGTVSVASARLEGMSDFLLLPVSHTMILHSREAADQTLTFLRTGRFQREPLEVKETR
jgi:pimeloyl-ACP methyl ester carboxylesterase